MFVSDSGAGKVIRVEDGKAVDVITDFPIDVYGKGPKYNIGPLGLVFLDKGRLVVGGGGLADGEELLRIYDLEESAIKADKMASSFKLEATDDIKGEGNFYGVAATKDAHLRHLQWRRHQGLGFQGDHQRHKNRPVRPNARHQGGLGSGCARGCHGQPQGKSGRGPNGRNHGARRRTDHPTTTPNRTSNS